MFNKNGSLVLRLPFFYYGGKGMSRALVDYIHYNMANYWNNGQGNIEDPRKGALAISNLS